LSLSFNNLLTAIIRGILIFLAYFVHFLPFLKSSVPHLAVVQSYIMHVSCPACVVQRFFMLFNVILCYLIFVLCNRRLLLLNPHRIIITYLYLFIFVYRFVVSLYNTVYFSPGVCKDLLFLCKKCITFV